MSKLNCIDKKRSFHSFLIYIFVAACLLFGCATRSSDGIHPAADVDPQSNTDQVNTDTSPSEAVGEDMQITEVADEKVETNTAESAVIKKDVYEKEYTESEPRIFFKPSDSKLGQILGIDFSPLPLGKSRLTVTTNQEVKYDLDSINADTLALNIYNSKISDDILLRYLDTTKFQTPVGKIKPVFDKEDNKVSLGITMREVVPYTIKQSDDSLIIDFDRIKSKIVEKKIIPLNLVEAETRNLAAVAETRGTSQPYSSQAKPQAEIQAFSPSVDGKYIGSKLDLEFADEDVTNILRLINDVSGENIIWDPGIKGKTVSMILKDVPWDQALELILKNNELAKRYVGENIVWITSKQKMAQILAEEEAEDKKIQEKLELERQKLVEQKKRVEDDSPLITEYLPVDFAIASDIQGHIITSKRGNMSIDERTNTIIISDTAASIEEAKNIVKQFDTPVKQIMIEARVVEAADDFTRDLGLKWNSETEVTRSGSGTDYGGSFSTNSPAAWGNIGINFAKITSGGSVTLDATLALAESTGTAKTISAPKVIAQEGSEATISSGEIIKIAATENVAAEDFPAELSLSVTPTSVSFNDYITLTVDVSDDQRVADNRKTTKTISTTLMVKSGETIVIGGILKEKENETIEGIPVLKDIPGLGWLFKAKRKQINKTELLIFLTPNVIPSPVKNF